MFCVTQIQRIPLRKFVLLCLQEKKPLKTIKAEKVAPNAELKIMKFTYQCSVKDMNNI